METDPKCSENFEIEYLYSYYNGRGWNVMTSAAAQLLGLHLYADVMKCQAVYTVDQASIRN